RSRSRWRDDPLTLLVPRPGSTMVLPCRRSSHPHAGDEPNAGDGALPLAHCRGGGRMERLMIRRETRSVVPHLWIEAGSGLECHWCGMRAHWIGADANCAMPSGAKKATGIPERIERPAGEVEIVID